VDGPEFTDGEPLVVARSCLDAIRENLVWVHLHRTLWKETIKELDRVASPDRGTWRAHYARLYVDAQVMSVRRVAVGTNKGEHSLRQVLRTLRRGAGGIEIKQLNDIAVASATVPPGHPSMLQALARLQSEWGDGRGYLSEKVIDDDLGRMTSEVGKVTRWADKAVAHIDPVRPTPPSFGNLDAAIDTVAAMYRRYGLLLTGSDQAIDALLLPLGWHKGLSGLFAE
jgi:hypothetical protein